MTKKDILEKYRHVLWHETKCLSNKVKRRGTYVHPNIKNRLLRLVDAKIR